MPVFLQAALNGDRIHPAAPRTPQAIAEAALAAWNAGAQSVHVHAYDLGGHDLSSHLSSHAPSARETLDATTCGRVLRAIEVLCPSVPVSLTTSATIVPDPVERLRLVERWTALPALVSANQGEAGIVELCELLLSRGVAIEAGLLSLGDARAFVRSGLAPHCRRVLIEPLDEDPATAVEHAAAIEAVLHSARIPLEQVHHGYGIACWAVNRRALTRGHGIRTGFEDVTVLPDGTPAQDNAALVRAAQSLIHSHQPPAG
jgi:uncharacterized protein (DUF849 family)